MKAELRAKSVPLTDKWGRGNRKRKISHFVASFQPCPPGLLKGIIKARMNFKNLSRVPPFECQCGCPFVFNRRPITHLEIGVIRLMRARRLIRPTEALDAQEEKETAKTDTCDRQLKERQYNFMSKPASISSLLHPQLAWQLLLSL